MADSLQKRVLVVEDDPFIAMDLQDSLVEAGYEVLGPVSTVIDALSLVKTEHINGAVLDVNLGSEYSSPVAGVLFEHNIPFVSTTGYDLRNLPAEFQHGDAMQKPYMTKDLINLLAKMLY
jgi:DNA-binding response OmpR family regulator